MDKIHITRAYLESLATGDLVKMADDLGLDLQDNPERVFVIEELLEVASLDEHESAAEVEITDSVIMETASLPKHYNITFIEVMIRDPLWAFVFWEIKASDAELYEKALDFNGYYLKVFPLEKSNPVSESSGVFTIPVKIEDTARYINLAPEANGTTWVDQYKVELCVNLGGTETVLAASNSLLLPGPSVLSNEVPENQLIRLSGYEDFRILKRNERPFRVKGSKPSCLNE